MEQELTEEEDRCHLVLEESSADEEEIEVNQVNVDYHHEEPNSEQEISRGNEESGLPSEERPIRARTISQATYQR
jgi:hypothetical protein